MKNRSLKWMMVMVLLGSAPGCAPLWLATGAVVGYAVSRDSSTIDLDRPWTTVWAACVEEAKSMGHVKREDPKRGRLDTVMEEVDVVLTLKQLSPSTVRIVIRARKNLLPKPEIAQRLGVGIVRRVG